MKRNAFNTIDKNFMKKNVNENIHKIIKNFSKV